MMRTKLLQCVAIVGVICAFSSIAAANDFSISWKDPITVPVYDVTQAGVPFNFTLTDATSCLGSLGVTSPGGCAGFFNDTGQTLTGFEIQFTVPTGSNLIGQTITYNSSGSPFATFSCTGCSAKLTAGEQVTFDFGGANFASGTLQALYLVIEGASPSDFPSGGLTGVVTVVPEPGSVLLLGGGLGLLVLLGFRRRRVNARC